MRLKIIRIVIFCLLLMLVLELFYVQVIRGRHFYDLSTNNRIRVVPLEGWRGRIIDRNGTVLAVSGVPVSGNNNLTITTAAGIEMIEADNKCPAICGKLLFSINT